MFIICPVVKTLVDKSITLGHGVGFAVWRKTLDPK